MVAIGVVVILVVVGAFVLTSASSPAYACTTIDTVQPSQPGQIGQVQPDMGNGHVVRGDKITYPVCPPASGHHVNQPPYGPVPPRAYGPDADVLPNGWVHNLEHGGLVLLYSCDKGACDAATQAQLQDVYTGFPPSPVCGLPAGTVGPVITRFEQMPTKFAALLWDRALYLNELDVDQIYAFFNKYAEVVDDQGRWLAPPEPQCPAPTPSSAAPVESPSPS